MMEKELAGQEKAKHANLQNKILIHKERREKMQVVEIGVGETSKASDDFYVYCKLKGREGDVTETLDYVLANYTTNL